MRSLLALLILSLTLVLPSQAWSAAPAKGLVAKKAAILAKMHKKAEKALVNAAQDKNFPAYFSTHDQAKRSSLMGNIEKVSLNVQKRFHVEEMCLIDAAGPELSRIVGKEIAHDLSPDERGANFFAPGFALKPRTALVSPLYMSPDANKWVLAYVTPILVGKDKKAILHYEHGLNVYQDALNKGVKGNQIVVAVTKEGWLVSDSRSKIGVAKVGDKEALADYFKPFELGGKDLKGVMAAIDGGNTVAGYEGAYKKVKNWTILAFQKK